MIAHIRYSQQVFSNPAECLHAIRVFLDRGWWLSSLSRQGNTYVATFGVDDSPTGSEG